MATNTATVTTTEDHNHTSNNSNENAFSVQHAPLSKGISCRVGDKIKLKDLNNNFRVLSNNANGLVMAHEGGELLEEST
eukprot:9843502-Ditylum_brightwellii.AAC.1